MFLYGLVLRFIHEFADSSRNSRFENGSSHSIECLPSIRMKHFYGVLVHCTVRFIAEPWNRPVTPDKSHGSLSRALVEIQLLS